MKYGSKDEIQGSVKDEIRGSEIRLPETIVIQGEKAEERIPWLERSVIGETLNPTSLDEVRRRIAQDGIEVQHVYSMGMYKFLITFN